MPHKSNIICSMQHKSNIFHTRGVKTVFYQSSYAQYVCIQIAFSSNDGPRETLYASTSMFLIRFRNYY